MFIDTHCHLSKKDYDNIDQVIKENRENKIDRIIISGCTKDSIEESIDISTKYNDVFLTVGFHPEVANDITDDDIKYLEEVLKNKKIVGIGEIGLDYYYQKENKEKQIFLFEKQLKMAEKLNLPVVIHSREATQDTIEILKKYNVKGVIHCFSGSIEIANIYIKMGFKLGIGGVVTFKNSNLYKVVENIGLKNIVLETDSPYLTPVPFRGKKNSSKYIVYIAEFLAGICKCSLLDVSKITSDNANTIFDLK